jgi:hypothetical protein
MDDDMDGDAVVTLTSLPLIFLAMGPSFSWFMAAADFALDPPFADEFVLMLVLMLVRPLRSSSASMGDVDSGFKFKWELELELALPSPPPLATLALTLALTFGAPVVVPNLASRRASDSCCIGTPPSASLLLLSLSSLVSQSYCDGMKWIECQCLMWYVMLSMDVTNT